MNLVHVPRDRVQRRILVNTYWTLGYNTKKVVVEIIIIIIIIIINHIHT